MWTVHAGLQQTSCLRTSASAGQLRHCVPALCWRRSDGRVRRVSQLESQQIAVACVRACVCARLRASKKQARHRLEARKSCILHRWGQVEESEIDCDYSTHIQVISWQGFWASPKAETEGRHSGRQPRARTHAGEQASRAGAARLPCLSCLSCLNGPTRDRPWLAAPLGGLPLQTRTPWPANDPAHPPARARACMSDWLAGRPAGCLAWSA